MSGLGRGRGVKRNRYRDGGLGDGVHVDHDTGMYSYPLVLVPFGEPHGRTAAIKS